MAAVLPPDAVITDVASTKAAILERADAAGLRFVGGHPMAGLDTTGYAAEPGRPFRRIGRGSSCPGRVASDEDVDRVTAIARGVPCAGRTARCRGPRSRGRGDQPPAAVVAAALVEAVAGERDGSAARGLAARRGPRRGGWRDMTRLARGDPAMGAGIAATNATAIGERLRDLVAVIEPGARSSNEPAGRTRPPIRERLDGRQGAPRGQ